MQARAGGGGTVTEILKDHAKYVMKPASAEEPIPEDENNALREMHRQAHKMIFETMSGKKAGDDKKAGGDDKAGEEEKAGKEEEKAGDEKKKGADKAEE